MNADEQQKLRIVELVLNVIRDIMTTDQGFDGIYHNDELVLPVLDKKAAEEIPVKKTRAPWGSKTGRTPKAKAAALIEKVKEKKMGRPPKERHYACNDCMNDFHATTGKLDTSCPSCDSVHVTEV